MENDILSDKMISENKVVTVESAERTALRCKILPSAKEELEEMLEETSENIRAGDIIADLLADRFEDDEIARFEFELEMQLASAGVATPAPSARYRRIKNNSQMSDEGFEISGDAAFEREYRDEIETVLSGAEYVISDVDASEAQDIYTDLDTEEKDRLDVFVPSRLKRKLVLEAGERGQGKLLSQLILERAQSPFESRISRVRSKQQLLAVYRGLPILAPTSWTQRRINADLEDNEPEEFRDFERYFGRVDSLVEQARRGEPIDPEAHDFSDLKNEHGAEEKRTEVVLGILRHQYETQNKKTWTPQEITELYQSDEVFNYGYQSAVNKRDNVLDRMHESLFEGLDEWVSERVSEEAKDIRGIKGKSAQQRRRDFKKKYDVSFEEYTCVSDLPSEFIRSNGYYLYTGDLADDVLKDISMLIASIQKNDGREEEHAKEALKELLQRLDDDLLDYTGDDNGRLSESIIDRLEERGLEQFIEIVE